MICRFFQNVLINGTVYDSPVNLYPDCGTENPGASLCPEDLSVDLNSLTDSQLFRRGISCTCLRASSPLGTNVLELAQNCSKNPSQGASPSHDRAQY
mmetsp:Transcript_19240/g.34833  ORF Transcript_19240/g.34833 Transcript_19240/m.34833 type:complete len:97 (+) Transcript_19240:95-385(+)